MFTLCGSAKLNDDSDNELASYRYLKLTGWGGKRGLRQKEKTVITQVAQSAIMMDTISAPPQYKSRSNLNRDHARSWQ